jgi:hypothetical protein
MRSATLTALACLSFLHSYCWGFYGHKQINYYAVFLLPPEMLPFLKKNIDWLTEHAVDPDKRRYAIKEEGPRHYIDIDHYGKYPFEELPWDWKKAVQKFSEDSLQKYGIVPWHVTIMLHRLTNAFREKDYPRILKNCAELGHYISDAHVPLHANSNHNGQFTGQKGIHGFWEGRIPELLAKDFDFLLGKAKYIENPSAYIWERVLESAKASDSVLQFEKKLTKEFREDMKYSFEERNGQVIRQYSRAFSEKYALEINGMVERRMRLAIFSVASFWYTAWLNAGQPELTTATRQEMSEQEKEEWDQLNRHWRSDKILGELEECQ